MGKVVELSPKRKVVWCLPAMRFFGQLAADTLGWELMVGGPVGDCDTCYIVGMYDIPYYQHTLQMTHRAKRRIIHWCGSDVLHLMNASILPEALHVADSQRLVDELRSKGVEATELMWPTRHHFEVTPLPEKPRIACYLGSDPIKYGADMFAALEQAMPEYEFVAYSFGSHDAEQMAKLVDETSVYVRLTQHDGSAASAREFMEAGRRAITTNGIDYAVQVNPWDLTGIIAAVRKCASESEPDYDAAAYWSAQNADARYKGEFDGITRGR